MQLKAAIILALAAIPAVAVMLERSPTHASVNMSANISRSTLPTRNATAADIAKLHKKMEVIAVALEHMIQGNGSLTNTKVAPALRTFVTELRVTLNVTASPKDMPAALRRLQSAQAGVADLTKALDAQQQSLMHQDAAEETNLLLGVLMTRKGDPMSKQLEILQGADFSGLPVSKVLLAKHDNNTPLFQQVALYIDAHGVAANASGMDAKAQKLAKTITFFEQKVSALEHEEKVMQGVHERRMAQLDSVIKQLSNESAHRMLMEKKHAEREYKKKSLVHKQRTQVMLDVVAALKRGDAKALKNAQEALQKQMRDAQARTGDFLHLLQLGHRLASRDCPYCVAQCIGKCHDGGSPYALCMTECADSGH